MILIFRGNPCIRHRLLLSVPKMYHSLWIFGFLMFSMSGVSASGVFEVSVLNLNNNRGVTENGRCCMGARTTPPCTKECTTFISVCLLHAIHDIPLERTCTFGSSVTSVLGGNNIAGGDLLDGYIQRIPITFTWRGSFTLIIEAWHDVYGNQTRNDQSQRIVQSMTTSAIHPSNIRHEDTAITPTTEIRFTYRFMCNKDYFGSGCNIYCRPRDDQLGHYQCQEDGSRDCLTGWKGSFCQIPECSQRCLIYQGVCERPHECRCRIGWQGPDCDQCKSNPGCLHGFCYEPWQCICHMGWTGRLCDIDIMYCSKSEPCINGGMCRGDNKGNYTCLCPHGYAGVNCEYALCQDNFCLNGGTCKIMNKVRTCSCPYGFYGDKCQFQELTCNEITCLNDGLCIMGSHGAECTCRPGFSGLMCELDTDECYSNPCLNDGICHDKVNGYHCQCTGGHSGFNCGDKVYPCTGHVCKNNGTCAVNYATYRPFCECKTGYNGDLCQIPLDPCDGIICSNGGTCITSLMNNGFICSCAKGYRGENCEMKIDPCFYSRCKNGATCKSYTDSFLCVCSSGYTGKLCEREVMASDQIDNRTKKGEIINDKALGSGGMTNSAPAFYKTIRLPYLSFLTSLWLVHIIILYRINQT